MKHYFLLIFIILIQVVGCSDNSTESQLKISEAEKVAVAQAHESITKSSSLAVFMNELSDKNYEKAIALLHPKLKDAWTEEKFEKDWRGIRNQLSTEWGPEATGTFSGNSTQGPYEQATYRLSKDWRSLSSIDLVSMKIDGQESIVRIHLRIPYKDHPPDSVIEITNLLTNLIFNEKYSEAEEFMTQNCKKQFPEETIKQIRPVLGSDESKIEKNFYRFFANAIWYDAARLNQADNGFSFLELILTSENNKSKLASLSFRGALK
jgi:hypothetical protein